MFTGIVQSVGKVIQGGRRMIVRGTLPYEIPVGGSVAVNGCCLTHVGADDLTFDLSDETLSRTTLGSYAEGRKVNLEAALRSGEPMGGHVVQGHIDTVGEFLSRDGEVFRFRVDEERYLADKGSICIDGISLTVISPSDGEFSVAVIPHTLASTNFHELSPGDKVNIEFDALAKYAEQLKQKSDAR